MDHQKGAGEECGLDPSGEVKLECRSDVAVCVIPGPVIYAMITSDRYTVKAAGDNFGEPECFPVPVHEIPPGYLRFLYVDSVGSVSYGEDDARFRIFERNETGEVCASSRGQRNGLLFLSDGPPVEVHFRINVLVYNPSLLHIETHVPHSPNCPVDVYGSEADGVGQPCITSADYAHTAELPPGFEGGVGLAELRMYNGNGADSFFVSTVVSIAEISTIAKDDLNIDVNRWFVFVLSWNYACGGAIGFNWHLLSWRKGLRPMMQLGRLAEPIKMGGVEVDYGKPAEIGEAMNFAGIMSYNLNNAVIRDDIFFLYCGAWYEGLPGDKPLCDPQYPHTTIPYQNEIEDYLSDLAAEGATKLCNTHIPMSIADICTVAGMGVDWIIGVIFDALFPVPCGDSDSIDSDSDWIIDKNVFDDGGVTIQADMRTYDFWGDGEAGDDHSHITVQALLLGFVEPGEVGP